jgi:hypothetical protein
VAFDISEIWSKFKSEGFKVTLIALLSSLGFLAINKIVDNALTKSVDNLEEMWSGPPTFLIPFSEPVDDTKWVITKDGTDRGQVVTPDWLGTRAAKIRINPGIYLLKLYKTGSKYVLNVPMDLHKGTSISTVDASETRWALETETTHFGGGNIEQAPNLISTRWTTTQADWAVVASAGDSRLANIVKLALGQVGVTSGGSEYDQKSINDYWKATNLTPVQPQTPWGGAFLNWVIKRADASPENESPSFRSWLNWGDYVQTDTAKPGMIAIFDFPYLVQAPSQLLVGIFLRQRPECTEVVVGNIAKRVVITCVSIRPKLIRKPTN